MLQREILIAKRPNTGRVTVPPQGLLRFQQYAGFKKNDFIRMEWLCQNGLIRYTESEISQDARKAQTLAAAYEVDDFVTVAGLDCSIGPLWAREDFEVAFDRDPAGREIQIA